MATTYQQFTAHLSDFVNQLSSHPIETLIAGGATVSPIWLPWLHEISSDAALLTPILGCLWFVFQFYRAFKKK